MTTYDQSSVICPKANVYPDELLDEAADELEVCLDCDAVSFLIGDYIVQNLQSDNCQAPQ